VGFEIGRSNSGNYNYLENYRVTLYLSNHAESGKIVFDYGTMNDFNYGDETGQSIPFYTGIILDGNHVTNDVGTGLVHTAPAHGMEDFLIITKNIDIIQNSLHINKKNNSISIFTSPVNNYGGYIDLENMPAKFDGVNWSRD
jgi:isoleucyl-tRNA synthetase